MMATGRQRHDVGWRSACEVMKRRCGVDPGGLSGPGRGTVRRTRLRDVVVLGGSSPRGCVARRASLKGTAMGLMDKAKDQAEIAKGKAKEGAGDATDNERLEAEGQADQGSGNVKQAGEKIKDAFRD